MKTNLFIGFLSVPNAIVMMCFSFWLMNQSVLPFLHSEEMLLFQITSLVKILIGEDKPSTEDFIFINTAYDNQLVKIRDEKTGTGNRAITDREKLAKLFKILNRSPNNHRYILCDIFFQEPSKFDDPLETELKTLPNIVIPYHLDNQGNPKILPRFSKINKGLVEYKPVEGVFIKFNLQNNDTDKSLPVVMYEQLHNAKLEHQGFVYWLNNEIILHNFVLNLRIRQYDFWEHKKYNIINLGDFLYLPENIILSSVKNKIVVMGDFVERDIHTTLYGSMPGILILLNTYLALVNQDNVITIWFIVFLLIGFSIQSFIIFHPRLHYFPNLFFFLIIISPISYFGFNIHLNILYLSLYISFLVWIIKVITQVKKFVEKNCDNFRKMDLHS